VQAYRAFLRAAVTFKSSAFVAKFEKDIGFQAVVDGHRSWASFDRALKSLIEQKNEGQVVSPTAPATPDRRVRDPESPLDPRSHSRAGFADRNPVFAQPRDRRSRLSDLDPSATVFDPYKRDSRARDPRARGKEEVSAREFLGLQSWDSFAPSGDRARRSSFRSEDRDVSPGGRVAGWGARDRPRDMSPGRGSGWGDRERPGSRLDDPSYTGYVTSAEAIDKILQRKEAAAKAERIKRFEAFAGQIARAMEGIYNMIME
jgi:hypothetical protein